MGSMICVFLMMSPLFNTASFTHYIPPEDTKCLDTKKILPLVEAGESPIIFYSPAVSFSECAWVHK